jgi:hypothetical protein
MNTVIDETLRAAVNRNLLKFAAGQAIFCQQCNAIMDCKRTVVATIHRHLEGKEEECCQSWTLCAKCWAARGATVRECFSKVAAQHPELHASLEIVTWKTHEEITA